MRVTFITTKINFERAGGSVPDLDLKVKDMKALGAEVAVVTVFSELNDLPKDLPYTVHEEYTKNKSLPALQARIVEVLKKYEKDTDVFHLEGQFGYAGGWYRMLGGKPILAFYNREMLAWQKGGVRRIVRSAVESFFCMTVVPFIDYFIFTTPQLLAKYRAFGLRIRENQAEAMLDFFDVDTIRSRASVKKESGDGRLTLFASGRMVPDKGFHILIEALALVPEKIRAKIHVTIGGDGPERERLMHLAKERAVAVDFPGWLTKAGYWEHLSTADMFVLPRWHFELPAFVVYESLSLGIPTLAPGGGGVEWMAHSAISPFIFDDQSSLAQKLSALTENLSERTRLAKDAVIRARETGHTASRDRLYRLLSSVAGKR